VCGIGELVVESVNSSKISSLGTCARVWWQIFNQNAVVWIHQIRASMFNPLLRLNFSRITNLLMQFAVRHTTPHCFRRKLSSSPWTTLLSSSIMVGVASHAVNWVVALRFVVGRHSPLHFAHIPLFSCKF